MSVSLIAVTRPEITINGKPIGAGNSAPMMTIDEFVAYVARVSNPSNQTKGRRHDSTLEPFQKRRAWKDLKPNIQR